MHTVKNLSGIGSSESAVTVVEAMPQSDELAADLTRLAKEERIRIDRRRAEELARLRAVQSHD